MTKTYFPHLTATYLINLKVFKKEKRVEDSHDVAGRDQWSGIW